MAKYAQLVATGLPSGVLVTIKDSGGKQVSNLFPSADATAPDNRARTADSAGALYPATYLPNGTYAVAYSGGSKTVVVSGASGLPAATPFDMATQAELDAGQAADHAAYPAAASGVSIAWTPSTVYAANQLVTWNGAVYRCLVAHTSGTAFSGPGTNWERWSGYDERLQRAAALRSFHVALANAKAGLGPCDICTIGTSITEGRGPTAVTGRWLDRLRDMLRTGFQPSGVAGGYGFIPPAWGNVAITPASMTVAGSPVYSGFYGPGIRAAHMTTSAMKATFTFTGTGFDILWSGGTGAGVGYYKVDGGSAVTFSTVLGANSDGNKTSVTGLAVASHTVEVGWSSGGYFIFDGAMLYNGDELVGIRVWDGGHSGYTSNQFINGNGIYWQKNLTLIQPALVLIELGANDPPGSVSVATFKANLLALIASVKANVTRAQGVSIVLTSVWERGDFTAGTWGPYYDAIRAVVAADPTVTHFDMSARTYPTNTLASANALGILVSDKVHPSDLGSQLWANALYEFLRP